MKALKVGSIFSLAILTGFGVAMAVTNPGQDAYEDYAARQLGQQLDQRLCQQAPALLDDACASLLENNSDWLRESVAENTQRQNFFFLSIYKTDLSAGDALENILPLGLSLSVDGLPAYHFETVGVFRQFYTYRAERR